MQINIKSIYKDKTVSEQFVEWSLELFAIRNRLHSEHDDNLLFFTRADMNREEYDYFPRPLPDAYIRLKESGKHFFLDIFRDAEPSFVAKRRIKQYIKYDEDGDWGVTETNLPTILAVCESLSLAKRVQKHAARALDDVWADSEVSFAFVTRAELMSEELLVWQRADELGERLALQNT